MSAERCMNIPTARCNGCAQVWLAPGLRPGERYACKGCGQLISVKGLEATSQVSARSTGPEGVAPIHRGRQDGR